MLQAHKGTQVKRLIKPLLEQRIQPKYTVFNKGLKKIKETRERGCEQLPSSCLYPPLKTHHKPQLSSHPPQKNTPILKYFHPGDCDSSLWKVYAKFNYRLLVFFPSPLQIPPLLPQTGKVCRKEGGRAREGRQEWKVAPTPLRGVPGQARRLRLPTWRVHLNVKDQLSGIGHHHFPPVRVIAVHIPHRVVHRYSRVPAGLQIRGWLYRLLMEREGKKGEEKKPKRIHPALK